jgi:hypothetical protein
MKTTDSIDARREAEGLPGAGDVGSWPITSFATARQNVGCWMKGSLTMTEGRLDGFTREFALLV